MVRLGLAWGPLLSLVGGGSVLVLWVPCSPVSLAGFFLSLWLSFVCLGSWFVLLGWSVLVLLWALSVLWLPWVFCWFLLFGLPWGVFSCVALSFFLLCFPWGSLWFWCLFGLGFFFVGWFVGSLSSLLPLPWFSWLALLCRWGVLCGGGLFLSLWSSWVSAVLFPSLSAFVLWLVVGFSFLFFVVGLFVVGLGVCLGGVFWSLCLLLVWSGLAFLCWPVLVLVLVVGWWVLCGFLVGWSGLLRGLGCWGSFVFCLFVGVPFPLSWGCCGLVLVPFLGSLAWSVSSFCFWSGCSGLVGFVAVLVAVFVGLGWSWSWCLLLGGVSVLCLVLCLLLGGPSCVGFLLGFSWVFSFRPSPALLAPPLGFVAFSWLLGGLGSLWLLACLSWWSVLVGWWWLSVFCFSFSLASFPFFAFGCLASSSWGWVCLVFPFLPFGVAGCCGAGLVGWLWAGCWSAGPSGWSVCLSVCLLLALLVCGLLFLWLVFVVLPFVLVFFVGLFVAFSLSLVFVGSFCLVWLCLGLCCLSVLCGLCGLCCGPFFGWSSPGLVGLCLCCGLALFLWAAVWCWVWSFPWLVGLGLVCLSSVSAWSLSRWALCWSAWCFGVLVGVGWVGLFALVGLPVCLGVAFVLGVGC